MYKTASPTSSTRSTKTPVRGFTLVEVLIAFALASILLTGIMTTFLMMGRTGQLAENYTELEVEARKALETFSRDAREANGVVDGTWGNSTVTFAIPDSSINRTATSYYAKYTFDDVAKTFSRQVLDTSMNTVGNATVLVTNVQHIYNGSTPNPYFRYFKYIGATTGYTSGYQGNYASYTDEVKQIELNFIAQRNASTTVATATDKVLSARFILRNK